MGTSWKSELEENKLKENKTRREHDMFSDGAYLFDAGWLFFAAWSLILLTFFVIAFGEDLLSGPDRQANTTTRKPQSPMRSANSRIR